LLCVHWPMIAISAITCNVIGRLSGALRNFGHRPPIASAWADHLRHARHRGPGRKAALIKSDLAKWGRVVKEAGIPAE
jgi:hypothetical protein